MRSPKLTVALLLPVFLLMSLSGTFYRTYCVKIAEPSSDCGNRYQVGFHGRYQIHDLDCVSQHMLKWTATNTSNCGYDIRSITVNDTRVNPNQTLKFNGEVHCQDTNIPPHKGNAALKFDGKDDSIKVNTSALQSLPKLTVNIRVKPNQLDTQIIVMQWQSYLIRMDGLGWFGRVWNENKDSASANILEDITDDWHMLTMTWDGSIVKYFQDAEEKATKSLAGAATGPGVSRLDVGFNGGGNSQFYDGIIDEVYIYNRSLTDSEVGELYRGTYTNTTGLILYLNLDGDVKDSSGRGNLVIRHGGSWTDGYVSIKAKVGFGQALKQTTLLINSTDGTFNIPNVTAPSTVGRHTYTVYVTDHAGNIMQNRTVMVIVDRIKIVEGGVTASSACLGETVTLWFRAVYEFDNVDFTGTKGILYVNGSAMEWSTSNGRWEYKYRIDTPSTKTFNVTGVSDSEYGLTIISDIAGAQITRVSVPWYHPVVKWVMAVPPITWGVVGTLIILAIIFRLGIIEVEIERPLEPSEQVRQQMDSLLKPLVKKDKRFILLERFLTSLLKENPGPEILEFLRKKLPAIVKRLTEHKIEVKDDES